jgi:DNA polymerase-3 subunit beta
MEFEIQTKEFTETLSRAEKITGKNLSLPVLRCVLIGAGKEGVVIRATNLDVGFESTLSATVKKEGVVALPADILNAFLQNVYEKNITLKEENDTVRIVFGKNTTVIKTYNSDEFPILPNVKDGISFTIDPQVFVNGLKNVWYSAASSSIKPELSSVYIQGVNQGVIFAATDGLRLAEKKLSAEKSGDFDAFLLPIKNVGEIIRNFEKSTSQITVTYTQNQTSFVLGNVHITSRVIDGTFPDYAQLIPKEFSTEIILLKQELIDALKLSTIFSNMYQQMHFSINPKEKKIVLKTQNQDVGENTITLEGTIQGEELQIHFNHRYISDALQSISADSVSLSFNGMGKPLVIRAVGDSSFTYLVMPMNR